MGKPSAEAMLKDTWSADTGVEVGVRHHAIGLFPVWRWEMIQDSRDVRFDTPVAPLFGSPETALRQGSDAERHRLLGCKALYQEPRTPGTEKSGVFFERIRLIPKSPRDSACRVLI